MPRWPAKLMSPVRTSVVTPGVSSAKLMKLRPLTGRLRTAASSTVELTCDRVVSMTGDSPVTVTVSATFATRISRRSVMVAPTVNSTFACRGGVKP